MAFTRARSSLLAVLAALVSTACITRPLPPEHPPEAYEPYDPSEVARPGPALAPIHPLEGKLVVVDAGHGGGDPGALSVTGTPEKRVNLAVARLLERELERVGANVEMVRESDVFVPLDDRASIADRTRCDLFVSIHADSFTSPSAAGPTVFVARGASPTSRAVGAAIDHALRAAGLPSRGVREAGFRVLVGHARPAVLVECGFLSNPAEARLLDSPAHQRELARLIADGIASGLGG